jgi:hypothetical protein
MADSAAQTTQMVRWLGRMPAGDASARDGLMRGSHGRSKILPREAACHHGQQSQEKQSESESDFGSDGFLILVGRPIDARS